MNKFFKIILSEEFEPKRVCGVIGFIVIMFIVIWCTIMSIQAPLIVDTFIWAVALLLGIDSIMTPFNKNKNNDKINT